MATIGADVLTLNDWAKRLDPDGKTAIITEILSQSNEILDEMQWKEGNLPTGEQTSVRTGLPNVFWRLINQGVPKAKSTTAQITENVGILEARSEVDEDEANLNGNVNSFRLSESVAFMESMSQEFASTLMYGSGANPEEFVGFSNRYNDLSAQNSQNIIDAGGTGSDNSSIWLVGWGPRTIFGVFPKGSKAGVSHNDLGLDDAFDSNNDRFRAYMDQYKWKGGLVIKDWRYAVRIANIDISDIITDTNGTTTNLIELMLKAIHRLPSNAGRHRAPKMDMPNAAPGINASFYANRTINQMLDIQAMNKSNLHLKVENEEGNQKLSLRGIPIRTVDALTESEARVV
ncbi:MAG: major capsid protein [Cyclobacteriaceae bacterium]